MIPRDTFTITLPLPTEAWAFIVPVYGLLRLEVVLTAVCRLTSVCMWRQVWQRLDGKSNIDTCMHR